MNISTEFIIGTIIGLLGLIPLTIPVIKKIRKLKLQELMEKLVDKDITQDRRQKILQNINRQLLLRLGKRLSKEYINGFSLRKRGKEAVFEEMCILNKIEPTSEFCKIFLTSDAPAIRERYYQHFKQTESNIGVTKEKQEEIDEQNKTMTNKNQVVYFSELLQERYSETCNQLITILDKHKVPHKFLKATKDIWCKDYMPVQTVSGKLVQFRYDPSYLKENINSRSDVKEVCKANNIQPVFSNINLDGGNVLICAGRAIISDRVFDENPEYTNKEELIAEIERLLEATIIIIPTQNGDFTGHADGMVRFVNQNIILGNDRKEEFKYWTEKINKVVNEYGIEYLDIPFFEYKDKMHPDNAIGIYVNYLEVSDLIIIPVFEVPGNKDTEAIERFKHIFPDRKIETINYNEIGLEGGLLNCTTWIIYE